MTTQTLAGAASRAAVVTLSAQGARVVIQLAGVVVLARLLTPHEYGLMAMVVALVGIADVVRDLGLGQAAVQARTLGPAERANLFWLNTLIGALLCVAAVASSWGVAALYGEPALQPVVVLFSATLLLRGMSVQFSADLSRSLRFGRLAVAETTGQIAGLAAAIALAAADTGVWALAWQVVVQAAVVLVLGVALTGWLPGPYRRAVPVRPLVRFGAALAGANLLNYASRNVDAVVIGLRFGPVELGSYNRAFQLMTAPLNQLQIPTSRVAVPVLARLQDDPRRFARYILAGQFALLLVVGVISAVSISQPEAVVRVALGGGWDEVAPLFQALAVGGVFQAATQASSWVFVALGLGRQQLLYALATRPVGIVVVVVGSQWGATGVAWAYTAALALYWPASLAWLARCSDAPVGAMLRNGLRGMTVVAVSAGAAAAVCAAWLPGDTAGGLAVATGIALVVPAATALLLPGFRAQVRETVGIGRQVIGSRRRRAGAEEGTEPCNTEADG